MAPHPGTGTSRTFAGLQVDSVGWLHPQDEADLVRCVHAAGATGTRLRVRGANHSVPAAVAGAGDVVLVLDAFQRLAYNEVSGEVTAGAGVRLGPDPRNPRGGTDPTLLAWMHVRGRALPNLGGITHQTVAGFLATGSGGGSTRHDCAASVVGLRLVDGTGDVHVLRRDTDADLMDAVLVSVGTCGIVTEVTFGTEPAYDVTGTETVRPDRGGELDLFADDARGAAAFFRQTDYARILWWPQRGVQRMAVWAAHRAAPGAAIDRSPYDPMPRVFGSLAPAQIAAGALLWSFVHWRRVRRIVGEAAASVLERGAVPVEGAIYRMFVSGDASRPQRFGGAWHDVLPQDQEMDERWMPTTFTEIFVPLARASEALRRLDAVFAAEPAAAGQFAIELYASPPSTAWLHPSFGCASLRVNVFWLTHSHADPRDRFLPRIWEALEPFGPRLHWGKLFPHEPRTMVAGRYPRLGDFLAVRARLDPDRVFLTPWMASALDTDGSEARPFAPLPSTRMPAPGLSWPLLFQLDAADRSLLSDPDHVFDFERIIAAPPEVALRQMFRADSQTSPPGLVRLHWHGPVGEFVDAVIDETFVFMSLRMHTVEYQAGRCLVVSVDRCSIPLARQMIQCLDVTPVDGGCRLRWRIAVRFRRDTGFASPVVTPFFHWLFDTTMKRLEAGFARARRT